MEKVFRTDNSQRFKKWKERVRHSNAWPRQRAKRRPVTFPSAKNHSSVNAHVRRGASRSIWKQIYEKHKNGEPSFRVIRVHSALSQVAKSVLYCDKRALAHQALILWLLMNFLRDGAHHFLTWSRICPT